MYSEAQWSTSAAQCAYAWPELNTGGSGYECSDDGCTYGCDCAGHACANACPAMLECGAIGCPFIAAGRERTISDPPTKLQVGSFFGVENSAPGVCHAGCHCCVGGDSCP